MYILNAYSQRSCENNTVFENIDLFQLYFRNSCLQTLHCYNWNEKWLLLDPKYGSRAVFGFTYHI